MCRQKYKHGQQREEEQLLAPLWDGSVERLEVRENHVSERLFDVDSGDVRIGRLPMVRHRDVALGVPFSRRTTHDPQILSFYWALGFHLIRKNNLHPSPPSREWLREPPIERDDSLRRAERDD